MKLLITAAILLFCLNISGQTQIEDLQISQQNIEESENLIIKAGYAYRYNDYQESLELYKKAKLLNPKNETIDKLIIIVDKEKTEYENSIAFNLSNKEQSAIKSLEKEALRMLYLRDQFDPKIKINPYEKLERNLKGASRRKGENIIAAIQQYKIAMAEIPQFEGSTKVLADLIYLGEKYSDPEDIYPIKYHLRANDATHLGVKLEYYITALNYNPSYNPSLEKLEALSLRDSYKAFNNTLISNGRVSILDNPIIEDYKIYSTVHSSIRNELIFQNKKALKKLNVLPWKIFGGLAATGALGVALVSFDATKVVFQEEKDGRTQLTGTGKVFDTVGWGLVFAAIPVAAITYPLTSKKKKKLKDKINYLHLYNN